MCMKKSFTFMIVLIPESMEIENDIDAYLQSFIIELKQLLVQSVLTFDALMNESFSMHVVLMWTINNFSSYALISSWSTKDELTCLIYEKHI